jgi:hypothetical protein
MAKVKIEITNDLGEKVIIERVVTSAEELDSFNNIEQFTLQIRRELFPELQKALLSQAQEGYKKKGKRERTGKGR